MIKPLGFDTSGSAVIRVFGTPLDEVRVHWASGARAPAERMLCPDSLSEVRSCKLCFSSPPTGYNHDYRVLVVGWDVANKRWCAHAMARSTFSMAWDRHASLGVTPAAMEAGLGADVAIQRMGPMVAPLVELIEGSLGKPRGRGSPPRIEDVAAELASRSLWRKHKTVDEAVAATNKQRGPV